MGQSFPVSYRLTARNLSGSITTNYRSEFVKLDYRDTNGDGDRDILGSLGFGAVNNGTDELSDRLAPHPTTFGSFIETTDFSWTDGIGDLETSMVFERDPTPDGPYAMLEFGLEARDQDGVAVEPLDLDTTLDGSNDKRRLGETNLRFGRLRLDDAFGPEVIDLPVPFFTEYWNGATYVRNADDSCTRIPREAINYPDGNLVDANNLTVDLGGGTTTGDYADLDPVGVGFSLSDADHSFSAPGAGNTGSFQVQIDLTNRPWLRHDWNQDGDFSDLMLPPANIGFGSYRGHDRVIYWREILQ